MLAQLTVLVRDFELGFPEGISSADDYLEGALALAAPDGDEGELDTIMAENKMKKAVLECFPVRRCFTLPHPGSGLKSLGTARGVVSAEFRDEVSAVVEVSTHTSMTSLLRTVLLHPFLANPCRSALCRHLVCCRCGVRACRPS